MIDEKRFYEDIIETTSSQGWRNILELADEQKNMINILNLKDAQDLHKAQGMLQVYSYLNQMHEFANGVLDDLENPTDDFDTE